MLQVFGVHCDGGLQERFEVPVGLLHRSAALTFDELALVEPLSIGAHAVRRAQIVRGDRVLVMGAGPIGLATMVAARVSGGRVWAMDVNEDRLQFCADRVSLDRATVVREHPLQALRGVAEDEWPSIVFDATGSGASMTRAFNLVPHAGRLIFVGLVADAISFDDPEFHRRELTLLASRNATADDFAQVIDWMEDGQVNARTLVTHRVPFDRLACDFPALLDPAARVFKTLVKLGG
jgi:threonine dehydrogenase-like Zn-dependent dehydrogenase